MKMISRVLKFMSFVASHAMCAVVAYNYCDLKWGMRYAGYSAGPEAAFAYVVPFVFAIGVFRLLSWIFSIVGEREEEASDE